MKQSQGDPVIDEIREVRHRISARVDHEPARLVDYYIELGRVQFFQKRLKLIQFDLSLLRSLVTKANLNNL